MFAHGFGVGEVHTHSRYDAIDDGRLPKEMGFTPPPELTKSSNEWAGKQEVLVQ